MQTIIAETQYAHYSIEDGIGIVTWNDNLVISIDMAKAMVEERIEVFNGKVLPFIIDIRELSSIDTLSRQYFAGERSITGVKAGALLIDSLISKLAGNIYVKVDKPRIPVRLFTNKDKAIKWLQQYK
jgi:hypothetical protein